MPDAAYSLADLCSLAGVTPRTVRYYVAEGLLRSPGLTGPGARYDAGHLARLRLIRRLQRDHLPLAEIRGRLAALGDDEAIELADGVPEPPRESALEYVRAVLGGRGVATKAGRRQGPATPPASASREARLEGSGLPFGQAVLERTTLVHEDRLRPEAANAPSVMAPSRPGSPVRSQWERIVLAPDVELHLRRPLTRSQNRAVARLVDEARRLLEENP